VKVSAFTHGPQPHRLGFEKSPPKKLQKIYVDLCHELPQETKFLIGIFSQYQGRLGSLKDKIVVTSLTQEWLRKDQGTKGLVGLLQKLGSYKRCKIISDASGTSILSDVRTVHERLRKKIVQI
jgi:hypothetical protein